MIEMSPSAATGFAADPALPRRDVLLDDQVMAGHLGAALGANVLSCRRRRVKYRVGESLRVLYVLRTDRARRLVAVRAFSGGLPAAPDGVVVLPDMSALGWLFPDDRKLRNLEVFWHEEAARTDLLGCAVSSFGLAAYAPEKSATLRCGDRDAPIAYTKLYAGGADVAAVSKYAILSPRLAAAGIVAPSVMSASHRLGAVALRPLHGVQLALVTEENENWRLLGRALGALHQTEVPDSLEPFTRSSPAFLRRAANVVASVRPDVERRFVSLVHALLNEPAPVTTPVVLHGDVHPKNVLIDEGTPAFVDLDQACAGPAAADLGSVIAALRADGRDAGAELALLEGYVEVAALPTVPDLSWHIAAALVGERILRAVHRVRDDTLANMHVLLDAVEHALLEMRS